MVYRRRFQRRTRQTRYRRRRGVVRKRRTYRRRRRTFRRRVRRPSVRRRRFSRRRRLIRSSGNDAFGSAKSSKNSVIRAGVITQTAPQLAEGVQLELKLGNPMLVFDCMPDDVAGVPTGAVPRSFPEASNGSFWSFNLNSAMRAVIASWLAFHNGKVVAKLTPHALGDMQTNHPEELTHRRNLLRYSRICTPRIRLTFVRRAGHIGSSYQTVPEKSETTEQQQVGAIAMASATAGTVTFPVHKHETVVTGSSFNYIAGGELPWYCQYVKGLVSGSYLYTRLNSGFTFPHVLGSGANPDPITGGDDKALYNRQTRLLTEMVSTKQWKRLAPSNSYSFDLYSRNGANDYLSVNSNTPGGILISLPQPDSTEDNSNYTQCSAQSAKATSIFLDATEGDWVTLPCCSGPNGTCVIWSPYSVDIVRANYDVYVTFYHKFKGSGASVLDWAAHTNYDFN